MYGTKWSFLLMHGSHNMRHTGFPWVDGWSTGHPGFWGVIEPPGPSSNGSQRSWCSQCPSFPSARIFVLFQSKENIMVSNV